MKLTLKRAKVSGQLPCVKGKDKDDDRIDGRYVYKEEWKKCHEQKFR